MISAIYIEVLLLSFFAGFCKNIFGISIAPSDVAVNPSSMQNNCGMQLTVSVMLGVNPVPNEPET